MESSVPHSRRVIRTEGHVLRPYQFSGDIPNDDEHYIPKGSSRRMALSLHG